MLMLDQRELDRFWPSAVLSNDDHLIVAQIGPTLKIGESSWAGFTSQSIFYSLCILNF